MNKEYRDAWKKKYYPIDAKKFRHRFDLLDEALQHSLQKWKGLKEAAKDLAGPCLDLELHDLIAVDGETCALCQACTAPTEYFESQEFASCDKCPLAQVRGGVPCDSKELISPYHMWRKDSNADPMISLIEQAIEHRKKSNDKV